MLEVGTNSYVTVEEADLYVSTFYRATDKVKIDWLTLTTSDKEALLLQAGLAIEQLPIPGRKSVVSQTLMFPRYPELEVSQYVKFAQAEEAFARNSDLLVEIHEDAEVRRLRGVRSYSLGNFSEAYRVHRSAAAEDILLSEKAYMYLTPYLRGGFDICL